MIKYNLKCHKNHEFESWFSDSKEFDNLFRVFIVKGFICPPLLICSFGIQPTNHSPNSSTDNFFALSRTICSSISGGPL